MTIPQSRVPNIEELLTLREVAATLRLSYGSVQRWAKEGKLPVVRLGKSYRVRRRDLEAWFETLRNAPRPETGPV